ncbi:hypothetical protein [Lysobacter sp. CA199]|uniref:hypothetical protein n=1 Tax=Lysobacter sp. CA199 TaxID=3455608 RepID=UPI003F8D2AF6
MKNTKRNLSRQAACPSKREANLRDRLEKKLLKVCADIGWICGWRKERMIATPVARRSSWRRVMLGRALAAEAKMGGAEAFLPVEATFLSSRRAARAQAEPAAAEGGLADFAIDLQDELVRLGRVGISSSEVARALGNRRAVGRQPRERSR